MQEQLYDQIGGRDAVEVIVDDFYDSVLGDERINHYFADQDMTDLRAHQIQFISSVTGGPVDYGGADMREAHAHLNLREEDFQAVAAHLETALRDNGVSEENIEQILARVAELKAPVLNQ